MAQEYNPFKYVSGTTNAGFETAVHALGAQCAAEQIMFHAELIRVDGEYITVEGPGGVTRVTLKQADAGDFVI